jgi:hypothetical protein
MFKEERRRVQEPELVSNDMEANNKPELLYGPWESGWSEQVNKLENYKLLNRDELLMLLTVVTDRQEEELLNSRVRGSALLSPSMFAVTVQ